MSENLTVKERFLDFSECSYIGEVYAVIKNATQIDPTAIAVSGDTLEVEEGKTITFLDLMRRGIQEKYQLGEDDE